MIDFKKKLDRDQFNYVDFLKLFFMFGMVSRHLPLYLLPPGSLSEYSMTELSLYSLFIPVTSAFLSIVGVGFSLSTGLNLTRYAKRVQKGVGLILLSVAMGFITYLASGHLVDVEFFRYFFLYRWDAVEKPGFYILFPIGIFYLLSFVQLLSGWKRYIVHAVILAVSCWLSSLYAFHYLVIGWIVFVLFEELRILPLFGSLSRNWQRLIATVALVLYGSCYMGLFQQASLATELLLLLLLFPIVYVLLDAVTWTLSVPAQGVLKRLGGLVLPFYLVHVSLLNVFSRFFSLPATRDLFLLEVAFFGLCSCGLLIAQAGWRKVFPRRV